MTNWKLGHVYN